MIGFEALNLQNSVTISSANRPLVYSHRGQVVVANGSVVDRPAVGSISFPAPIPTAAPPRLFVRVASSRHSSMEMYVVINGSSGAWTGFTIYAAAQGGGTLPQYILDYVIARPSFREPKGDWVFQLLDENGATVFCNEEILVRFSRFTKKWSLTQSGASGSGAYYTFYSGMTIDPDDFIDVTFFNRGIVAQTIEGLMFTGARLYSGSTRVLALQTQCSLNTSRPTLPSGMNFCTPICKFPVDRFPPQ